MEVPYFGDHPGARRRQINLGGVLTQSTHDSLVQDAKTRRRQRNEMRQRLECATRIQHWWRGRQQALRARAELKRWFEQDVKSITGLRCLILVGKDERSLLAWSAAMCEDNGEALLRAANDPSWTYLLRRVSALLLQVISDSPASPNAITHLKVLDILLSPQSSSKPSGFSRALLQYLLQKGYYQLLGSAITRIPVAAKSTPSLPPLIALTVLPFSVFDDKANEAYHSSLEQFITHILTIPLLPNRIPISSLTFLAPRIPLTSFHLISVPRILSALPNVDAHVNMLANLTAFTPARYDNLDAPALQAYLSLTTGLMNALPVGALDPPQASASASASNGADVDVDWDDEDSDTEPTTHVEVVSSFTFSPKPVLPKLDSKTRARFQGLPLPTHLTPLMNAAYRGRNALNQELKRALFGWLHALETVWPTRRHKIVLNVVTWSNGGLVRDLYRECVRGTKLRDAGNVAGLTDLALARDWPPLLFLVDLYNQCLLTMGDDEFFGTTAIDAGHVSRNPLTLDELTWFSRTLLNIVFLLYWNWAESSPSLQDSCVPGVGNLRWEEARERMTKLLQAIHARDSRKPFLPKEHWLMSSKVDIAGFVEAAVYEERTISHPDASQNQRTRQLSRRQIAVLSPRLGVLHHIPFSIPFDVRVNIFRSFIRTDKVSRGLDAWRAPHHVTRVTVRRGSIAQDGFDRLDGYDLRGPIAITFIDQWGQEEAGIDGGGVFKEFFTSLCKEVFHMDRGLWMANNKQELYPSPLSYATEPHSLAWYRFIGRILGKALYDGILIDIAFAGFFLAKMLGKQSFLDDLFSLDPELYKGLIYLKHCKEDPAELALTFSLTSHEFGETKSVPLIPNGDQIPVTRENRLQYIYLVAHHHLNKQIKQQTAAFFEGLSEIIDPKWLQMFNQQELQILMGGVDSPIDVDDLRQSTQYGGLYSPEHPTIQMFWKVVNGLDKDQRSALLRFATSCSRPPLLGFKELVPTFCIRDAGEDENRLPTASTCINLLKLPRYKSEQALRAKLVQAIQSNAGFDLS